MLHAGEENLFSGLTALTAGIQALEYVNH
jgi:hypothetical protein